MPPNDDVITLPLNLVVNSGRRRSADDFSPTLGAEDSVSTPSASPDSSPATDTGIETSSDVSSVSGDAAVSYRSRFAVLPAATTVNVKPELDAPYRTPCDPTQQVREPSTPPPPSNFQRGVTVGYTYEAFIATDGRCRRRKVIGRLPGRDDSLAAGGGRRPRGRYTCSECGRHYATSSNLSRHKQTHRSLDSRYARACPHCQKPYVSMPALAMHILTHDLKLVASALSY